MGFISKQLLKVIEWEDTTFDTIAYKFPMPPKAEIMNGSQLIVREGQCAILVSSGKIADIYSPGRYKLTTGNMPVLTALNSWKYGFNSPFVCDVYYINTKQFTAQKWGTSAPVMMRDQDFGMVQFRSFGQFSFKVDDPQVFLRELMGSGLSYKTSAIEEQLKRSIVSGITESVAASNIPALDLAMRMSDLESKAQEIVSPNFMRLGIKLVQLTIENISLTEESKKALEERTRMNILGSAQEYTAFAAADSMKEIAKNAHLGGGGNLSGIGLGLGTGTAMAGLYSGTIAGAQNATSASATAEAEQKRERFKAEQESRAEKAREEAKPATCPKCGASNKPKSKFCAECGAKMIAVCPSCKAEISPGAKFCPECGTKFSKERKCPECGRLAKPGENFCADCGSKI